VAETTNNDNPEAEEEAEAASDEEEAEEKQLAQPQSAADLQPTAKVVGVIRRAWRR
jgi:hypothetical protein